MKNKSENKKIYKLLKYEIVRKIGKMIKKNYDYVAKKYKTQPENKAWY